MFGVISRFWILSCGSSPPRSALVLNGSKTGGETSHNCRSTATKALEHSSGQVKHSQLTIIDLTKDAADLQQTLQHLKATQHLNLSAFCRAAIAEKFQRHLQQEALK